MPPPKPTTLGFVKTQTTLGKFFTLPAGTKPPVPVQSKLKSKSPKEKAVVTDDDDGAPTSPTVKKRKPPARKTPTKGRTETSAKKVKIGDEPQDEIMGGTPEAAAVSDPESEQAESDGEEEVGASRTPGKKSHVAKKEVDGTPAKKRARSPVKPKVEPEEDPELPPEEEPVSKRSKRSSGTQVKKTAEVASPTRPKEEPEEEKPESPADEVPVTKRSRTSGASKAKKTAKVTSPTKPKAEPEEEPELSSEGESVDKRGRPSSAPKAKKATKVAGYVEPKVEAEEEPDLSSEEEPVSKRNKRPSATKAKKTAEVASPVRPKEESEEESELPTDEVPATKRSKPSGASKAKKTAKATSTTRPKIQTVLRAPPTTSVKTSAKRKPATVPAGKAEESGEESPTPDVAMEESDKGGESGGEKPTLAGNVGKAVIKTLTGPVKHPFPDWVPGSPTPYAALVKTFGLLDATTKRLEKISHTSLFLRQVLRLSPDELLLVIHLMINKLAADFEGIELGIGESLLMKAIGESCGRSIDKIRENHRECGDLGMVAMNSRNKQSTLFAPKPLTVASVHQGLLEIATTKGDGAQGRKVSSIMKLLAAAKGDEAKYLVRGLEGKLRLGLQEATLIASLSGAVMAHEAEVDGKRATPLMLADAERVFKSVFSELPSYEAIIPAISKYGIMNLKDHCKLTPGVPLKPMLAKPTKSISEVLDQFEGKRFTCEYKYDGERAQIHYVSSTSPIELPGASTTTANTSGGIAKVFSRNSEDLSQKYPDILAALDEWIKPGVESFVLDCEAVAWDKEQKRVLPFQQLMTRKKKDVAIEDVKVKVCVFAFDMLFLDGKALVRETLEERRRLMHKSFNEIEGQFVFAKYMDGNELEEIQTFLEESVKASCEGLMVKTLQGEESKYEPSKRSRNWLKIKKDYLSGVGDSLDLVVLGAYHGKGKRTSWYGAFLLACYNPQEQVYETICNIGTGFSEVNLEAFHEQLSELEIERPKKFYSHAEGNQAQPDVWFEPKVVWEVKTADLSLSPKYKAAAGLADTDGGNKGISLRFPRFIRVRDDKGPEQATTSSQVADMYKRQEVVASRGSKAKGIDDDFEY